ncbi:hypothetical protein MXL82_04950 [Staphylococcus gallinarum]|uniref:hypothetical protein n=1 Tax=Staphylococcus gallinarum TaxID=1293 RepID=UPI002DBEBE3E|nr:hypothetical protein [Staphylococcus gallinarum]MEB6242398.1 hypothetical protein [Staphylococcus gallinarum]MEB6295575.1 hypothetical protein [Staphylococcus gallinarum]
MKKKIKEGDTNISVNSAEIRKLKEMKDKGYLLKYDISGENSDGTYDVFFVPTEKFKELY